MNEQLLVELKETIRNRKECIVILKGWKYLIKNLNPGNSDKTKLNPYINIISKEFKKFLTSRTYKSNIEEVRKEIKRMEKKLEEEKIELAKAKGNK